MKLSYKTDPGFPTKEYTYPLAMMEVALIRYLPGRNAMFENDTMYQVR